MKKKDHLERDLTRDKQQRHVWCFHHQAWIFLDEAHVHMLCSQMIETRCPFIPCFLWGLVFDIWRRWAIKPYVSCWRSSSFFSSKINGAFLVEAFKANDHCCVFFFKILGWEQNLNYAKMKEKNSDFEMKWLKSCTIKCM
jgi:hypothetical protein